jgi:hypothetical protein
MRANETDNDSVQAQKAQLTFDVLKWIWGGGAAILIAIGSTLYSVSTDSIEMRHTILSVKERDAAQDKRLDDQLKILSELLTEQVKTNAELKRMNTSVEFMIKDMKKDLERYRRDFEKHVENKKAGD